MKVLVCGGREYNNKDLVYSTLDMLLTTNPINFTVIHGDCKTMNKATGEYQGADYWAGRWALEMCQKVIACPANWGKYKNAAGPIRNKYMLETHKPDLVVAFPGGKGTADMKEKAEKAGVVIMEVEEC